MKKIIITTIALLFPLTSFAVFSVGWSATSTNTNWISPNLVNGVLQVIRGDYFIATSTTATSTLPNLSITQGLFGADFIKDFTGTNLSVTNGVLNATGGGGGVGWASTTADTESIYFYGTNNVGIGSSSPYAKLSVTNTDTQPSFVVEDSASPDSTPFMIDNAGKVGIGTTSPTHNLFLVSRTDDTQYALGIFTLNSGFGYDIGRNTSDGFLHFDGNQGGFSGVYSDSLKSGGEIYKSCDSTCVVTLAQGDNNIRFGGGSGTPSANLQLWGASLRLGTNSIYYDISRNGGTGLLEFNGNQGAFTGYTFQVLDGTTAAKIDSNSSLTVGTSTAYSQQFDVVSIDNSFVGARVTGFSSSQTADIFQLAKNPTATNGLVFNSNGNLGIGTTSPYANLSIQSDSSTGDAFAVATSTGASIGGYDNDGHRFSGGPTGVISSCGTGSPIVSGDDQGGTITTGTAATTCTYTFAKAYRATPYCNVSSDSTASIADIASISTSAVTFGLSVGLSGGKLYYSCAYHK